MKKIVLVLAMAIGAASLTNAQAISGNALGIRIGDGDGLGTEISYQRALGENNRLEVDLGYEDGKNFNAFKLSGMYHWVWNIDGGFNWYAGPGAGFAAVSVDDDFRDRNDFDDDGETSIFVGGQVGIEYNFDIPLLLSLDVRPEFYFGDFRDGNDMDIALGVRYQF